MAMDQSTTPAVMRNVTGSPNDGTAVSEMVKRYDNIVKAQEDKRQYRGLLLGNRMKVLLVSDTRTDIAAAALDVSVGYMSDPDELPGLANLCQHVLMLGSKLNIEECKYDKIQPEHQDSCDIASISDHSIFHFKIPAVQLNESIADFINQITSPLFPETAISSQVNRINSTHRDDLCSDISRVRQLLKTTALRTHPYGKFGNGNKDTLETIPKSKNMNVRDELLQFHNKWYSSNIMTLVVLGKQSLDELEDIVLSSVSAIEDKSVISPMWPEHPIPLDLRGKMIYSVPVNVVRILSIEFSIPDVTKYYKTAPGHYISYLLSHTGPGGLLAALRKTNWCTSFEDSIEGTRGFSFFRIQIQLTEEGLAHTEDIIHLVFQYLAMLRAERPQRWAWEELRDLKALQFRFKDVEDPRSFVKNHVRLLQDFPMEDVLSANYLMTEWNPNLIAELLSLLTPKNMRILVTAKEFADKCTMTEPWHGTKYWQENISEHMLNEWSDVKLSEEFHLPPPNEFIPSSLALVNVEEATSEIVVPILVKDTPLMTLWYKEDTEFLLPKAWITFDILSSPLPNADPLSCNLTIVWVYLLKDSLQQLAYASHAAGILWKIDYIEHGITVTLEGFNDKQPTLLNKIMDHIVNFRTEMKQLQMIKENYITVLNCMQNDQSLDVTSYKIATCIEDIPWNNYQLLESNALEIIKYEMVLSVANTRWNSAQLMETVKDINVELLNEFIYNVIRNVHIEGFVFGNFTIDGAVQVADFVEKKFPTNDSLL